MDLEIDLDLAGRPEGLVDGPFFHFKRPGFLAIFILAAEDDPETCCDTDVHVYLDEDGSHWTATMFTTAEIERLMERGQRTGDARTGWFWWHDLVITARPGLHAMLEVLMELHQKEELVTVLTPQDEKQ
jgi:hypothetical protein